MESQYGKLQVLKTTVKIGLPEPVKLLHVTDTHVAYDDPGNNCGRQMFFDGGVKDQIVNYFQQALAYAKENQLPIVHTGDLIDYISNRSLEYVANALDGIDYLFTGGNHDFCHCVGKLQLTMDYKWENIPKITPYIRKNMMFDSRLIGGLKVVMMDDSFLNIGATQLEMLKAEVARGYPILLCVHIPFFTPKQAETCLEHGHGYLSIINEPLDYYNPKYNYRCGRDITTDETRKAYDYIMHEPMIKCILAGHQHFNNEEVLENGLHQIITHGSYAGFARELTFI